VVGRLVEMPTTATFENPGSIWRITDIGPFHTEPGHQSAEQVRKDQATAATPMKSAYCTRKARQKMWMVEDYIF
jgi:hypothetical protein